MRNETLNLPPKTATAPRITILPQEIATTGASTLKSKGAHITINTINWEEFPYRPAVDAYIAHDGKQLFTLFEVTEQDPRAEVHEDFGEVWTDSCAEIFLQVPGTDHYFNFETTCKGVALAARRNSRTDFSLFTPEELQKVKRIASLAHDGASKDAHGNTSWWLLVAIPFALIGCQETPRQLKGNFYKCGDSTLSPHFLSWSPIHTPSPNFHCPEFFGTINFE